MAALRDDGEVAAMTPPILYEDNHLLAAIKPHMVPSQADASGDPDMLTLLKAYIDVYKRQVLDAPSPVISALSGKLGMLKGVSSKTIYSKI